MSKLNISVFLSTYSDDKASNAPSLTNFKWNRSISGIDAVNAVSMNVTLAPGETKTLFTGAAIKKLVYLETSAEITHAINGAAASQLKPIVINNSVKPGILLRTSDITSLVVTNPSLTASVTIFLATVE